jgi:hypothetical protein
MPALLLLFALASGAPVTEIFTSLAAALSDGDATAFMRPFDPAMPGYGSLRANVAALLAQADVTSLIEFLDDDGGEDARTVRVDWLVQIRGKGDAGMLVRRREAVTCRLERRGKKWVITSIGTQALFAPPRPSP